MQNYQTNIGILYQQTKLRTYPAKFVNPQIIQPKFLILPAKDYHSSKVYKLA